MSTFKVGEVAIYHNPDCPVLHGLECTVISGLMSRECWLSTSGPDLRLGFRDCYRIVFPDRRDSGLVAFPEQLRKRRPPQDWSKLCALDSVKAGEPMGVA